MDNVSLESLFVLLFKDVLYCEIEGGIYEKFNKMYQWFHEEITPCCNLDARLMSP